VSVVPVVSYTFITVCRIIMLQVNRRAYM
jgi:hypothetical protein